MTKHEKQNFKTKYNKFWQRLGVENAFEHQDVQQVRRLKDGSLQVITWYMGQTFYRTKYKELKTTLKEIGPFEYINKEESKPKWQPVD